MFWKRKRFVVNIMVLCKKLHSTSKMGNWLGTFYMGGLRLGNLGESLDKKEQLDQTKDHIGKIKTYER